MEQIDERGGRDQEADEKQEETESLIIFPFFLLTLLLTKRSITICFFFFKWSGLICLKILPDSSGRCSASFADSTCSDRQHSQQLQSDVYTVNIPSFMNS